MRRIERYAAALKRVGVPHTLAVRAAKARFCGCQSAADLEAIAEVVKILRGGAQ